MWFKRRSPDITPPGSDMRALTIIGEGADADLHEQRLPLPLPGKGHVRIRVAYAGLNRADIFQRQGSYRAPEGDSPIPGLEVSGTIDMLGDAVVGWSVGEKVCALTPGGGYADHVVVPASHLLALPNNLSLQQAAALPEACATAYLALMREASARYGERVLLHGGASGVGLILIQVARALGAEVYATASTAEKRELVASVGAKPLTYDPEHFADTARASIGGGVDVVIDTLGGLYMQQHLRLLNPRGRMVSLAFLEGPQAVLSMGPLLTRNLRWSGTTLRAQSPAEKAEIMEAVRKQLWPMVAAGHIRPVIDRVFPFDKAREAQDRMENRLNSGKIVLEVHQPDASAA